MISLFFIYFVFIVLNRTLAGQIISTPIIDFLINIETKNKLTLFLAPKIRYAFECPICFVWWMGLVCVIFGASFFDLTFLICVVYSVETIIKLLQRK